MMEEGEMIYDAMSNGRLDEALALITSDIAQKGIIRTYDILTNFCALCETEERGFEVANVLISLGYVYRECSYTRLYTIATKGYSKLLRFILITTKLCKSSLILNSVIRHVNRKQLEIFMENGAKSSEYNYQKYLRGRENARIASIALIGAARYAGRGEKDVMHIISRVVWSERDDEKWMDLFVI